MEWCSSNTPNSFSGSPKRKRNDGTEVSRGAQKFFGIFSGNIQVAADQHRLAAAITRKLFTPIMIKITKRILFFSPLLALLLVTLGFIAVEPVFGPLDAEQASQLNRATLIRIIQLRDFRQMSPETVDALTERACREFGRTGHKAVFEYSRLEKNLITHYYDAGQTLKKSGKTPQASRLDSNLRLMARSVYFRWLDEYDATSLSEHPAMMKEVVADLKWYEVMYFDFLHSIDRPIPPIPELLQDFDDLINSFKVGESDEKKAKIDQFKRRMNAVYVFSTVFDEIQRFLPMP